MRIVNVGGLTLVIYTFIAAGIIPALANDDDFFGDNGERPSDHVPTILSKPKNIYVDKGEKVVLECMVENLEPYSIIWMKGKKMLTVGTIKSTDDDRIHLEGTNLVIKHFGEKDEDDYICKISTNMPGGLTLNHKVFIKAPPKIEKTEPRGSDVEVNEGEKVTLMCDASGKPPPKITWKSEDFELQPSTSRTLSGDGKTLHFKGIRQTDAGQYECVAFNGVGQGAKKIFRVKVLSSLRDDSSKMAAKPESEKKEMKSEGSNGSTNGSSDPKLDRRAKMVAIMTAVILIAFF